VPAPRQLFAVGLNYADHAAESGVERPESPVIFTKFASAISGPVTTVPLPSDTVDWEVELVVVIGRGGRNIPADRAWEAIAGLSVGQDLSDRGRQLAGPVPQFSLAKSHRGFAPIGPAMVTIDEFDDPDDLTLEAGINGELVQFGRTAQMIFPVRTLIEHLSRTLELYPGDVVFTGTPAGVGVGRTPQRFLAPDDVLRSRITGIGELVQTFTAGEPATTRV
jgi:2-keto-4-pentenoate hydratase/2-oxohepta-3-ene-1,7-dioic acid hydratase in catechol pathway